MTKKQAIPRDSEILDMLTEIGWRFDSHNIPRVGYKVWDHDGELVHNDLTPRTMWFFYEKRILGRLKLLKWNAKVQAASTPAAGESEGE